MDMAATAGAGIAAQGCAVSARPGSAADEVIRRVRMSDEVQARVIGSLKKWFAGHPECSDPAEAIAALGLPDMTGIPADPKQRTSGQKRAAALARDIRQHAEYALRCRDNPIPVRRKAGQR
jgi:hypothetical protein